LNRRSFLTTAALLPWPRVQAADFAPRLKKPNPYEALLPFTDPARDEFVCEQQAAEVIQRLRTLNPAQRAWRDRFGPALYTRFYPLANNRLRFEVANVDAKGVHHYRTGHWNSNDFQEVDEVHVEAPKPLFRDVTAMLFGASPAFRNQLTKGVPYWRSRLDLATGINMFGNNGVAVGDIDNDGFDEIYVCQPSGLPNRLFKRLPGSGNSRYEDISTQSGVDVLDDTAAALFVDLRNSGRQDLIVLTPTLILLFLNDGGGRFRHVPDAFRFANPPQGTFTGISAADFDRDGNLDLYVCSYLYFQGEDQYRYPVPYHDAQLGPANFLFRNRLRENGFFEDVTEASGMNVNNNRYSFAASWCDYDDSGWPSLYVANDFGRNNLYQNENGKFRDIAAEAGVEDMGPGMSASWFDYDGDGRPDLYVANMWSPAGQRVANDPAFGPTRLGLAKEAYRGHTKGNSLFRNEGSGKFGYTGQAEMGRWAWSADGYDFDLDGAPEIYVVAGMISHSPAKDLMSFFWRQAVSKSPIVKAASPAYESGWNCLNQLVREDWSWNGHEPNVFYKRVDGKYVDYSGVSGLDHALDSRAFAVVDFDGDGIPDLVLKNRLGPQLTAYRNESVAAGKQGMVLELEGTGPQSNRDAIGARVRVNGVTQWLSAGSGYISQHTKKLYFGGGGEVEVRWPSGVTQKFAGLSAGFRYGLREGVADPVAKVALAARAPVASNTPIQAKNDLVFEPTWLYDPLPLPEKRPAGFVTIDESYLKDPELAAVYSIFRRYLFDYRKRLELPITFLVDTESRVRKVYPGVPGAAEKARDLKQAESGLPFREGRFYQKPGRSYLRFAGPFAASGYPRAALLYLNEELKRDPRSFKAQLAAGQIHLELNQIDEARQHLEIAAKLNPDSAELWNNLGGVEMAKLDYAAALRCFERALAIHPDLPFALVNAGQAQNRLGRPAEAEKLFRRALELVPGDADAANHLGLLLARRGDLTEASRLFQQAITHQRDHAGAINNLAVLYLRTGKPNDAIAALRYGIQQVPDYDIFYLNLARLHSDLGDKLRARQAIEELLLRRPDHAEAKRMLLQLGGGTR
jgi:Tfp pilus assembly protein PilF